MFESSAVPLIFTFVVPKNFKTSLKYVRINLVNLTAKGIIVSLQKIPYFALEYSLKYNPMQIIIIYYFSIISIQ